MAARLSHDSSLSLIEVSLFSSQYSIWSRLSLSQRRKAPLAAEVEMPCTSWASCLWITLLLSCTATAGARRPESSASLGSLFRARCAARCLSLYNTRITSSYRIAQVRDSSQTSFINCFAASCLLIFFVRGWWLISELYNFRGSSRSTDFCSHNLSQQTASSNAASD